MGQGTRWGQRDNGVFEVRQTPTGIGAFVGYYRVGGALSGKIKIFSIFLEFLFYLSTVRWFQQALKFWQ
jgi:hypothetical protein